MLLLHEHWIDDRKRILSTSQLNERIYRASYRASEFLRRHRTTVILGAFVFWASLLIVYGYFDELGETNTWGLIFGFFWLTIPMSFATYILPRVVLRAMPIMNGYKPDEDDQQRYRSDSG